MKSVPQHMIVQTPAGTLMPSHDSTCLGQPSFVDSYKGKSPLGEAGQVDWINMSRGDGFSIRATQFTQQKFTQSGLLWFHNIEV